MFLKIFLSSFFLFPIIYCQSYLEKGISEYNQRHLGCVEDQAKPEPISSAIGHFEKALDKDKKRVEAIKLLETVINRIPSADNFASDWEWIKKAKVILDDLKS